jgi:hypothetical protein
MSEILTAGPNWDSLNLCVVMDPSRDDLIESIPGDFLAVVTVSLCSLRWQKSFATVFCRCWHFLSDDTIHIQRFKKGATRVRTWVNGKVLQVRIRCDSHYTIAPR